MLLKARVCAHLLNIVTGELGLGNLGHKFIGEYSDDWVEAADHMKALIDGREAARVFVDDYQDPCQCTVMIQDIYRIIRPKALSEFDPHVFGVIPNTTENWMGDTAPDLEVDINMTDIDIPGLHGPRRALPRTSLHHVPKYHGSLSWRLH